MFLTKDVVKLAEAISTDFDDRLTICAHAVESEDLDAFKRHIDRLSELRRALKTIQKVLGHGALTNLPTDERILH